MVADIHTDIPTEKMVYSCPVKKYFMKPMIFKDPQSNHGTKYIIFIYIKGGQVGKTPSWEKEKNKLPKTEYE